MARQLSKGAVERLNARADELGVTPTALVDHMLEATAPKPSRTQHTSVTLPPTLVALWRAAAASRGCSKIAVLRDAVATITGPLPAPPVDETRVSHPIAFTHDDISMLDNLAAVTGLDSRSELVTRALAVHLHWGQ